MNRYVRVRNATRDTTVARRVRVARGLFQTIFGLHLLPRLKPGEGLLLPGATTIDTTFMGYPIDLVFVDRSLRVTRLVPDMVPWRMVLSAHGGKDCLELPGGALNGTGTEVGDQLALEDAPPE
jgi:uncharacterized membrane protein (UPF0127 family)